MLIRMSSGARAVSVFKCENQGKDWSADAFLKFQIAITCYSSFLRANSIKVSRAFSLKCNWVIGLQIAKSCYIAMVWDGLWPWPEGRVTRYCGWFMVIIPKVRCSEGPLFRRFDVPKVFSVNTTVNLVHIIFSVRACVFVVQRYYFCYKSENKST